MKDWIIAALLVAIEFIAIEAFERGYEVGFTRAHEPKEWKGD